MRPLKIGELAKSVGITVRTLHHYDRIGLLRPSSTTDSGHRLYTAPDVERLQQIISLKSMGLSLDAIGNCLDEGAYDLREVLTIQSTAIEASIERLQTVSQNLRFVISRLAHDQRPTTKELLQLMREVQTMERYYTPEQLKKLKERYERYPDKVKEVEQAWPVLFQKFEDAMKAGLSVTDLKVQVLAKEAQHYIDLFTGGDKEIEANLDRASAENRENALKTWNVAPEVFDFADQARSYLKKITES